MKRVLLAVIAALVAGCTITAEQSGSPALLDTFAPPTGGASAESIVTELGVPDAIDATDEGFRFVYRFRRRDESKFGIAYYVKLVTDQRATHREGALELWFDPAGRLLASKLREGDRDGVE